MGFFEYIVTYWDELEEKVNKARGVCFAATYTEAMSHVESYYGDTLIKIDLVALEPFSVYEFDSAESELFNIKVEDK